MTICSILCRAAALHSDVIETVDEVILSNVCLEQWALIHFLFKNLHSTQSLNMTNCKFTNELQAALILLVCVFVCVKVSVFIGHKGR